MQARVDIVGDLVCGLVDVLGKLIGSFAHLVRCLLNGKVNSLACMVDLVSKVIGSVMDVGSGLANVTNEVVLGAVGRMLKARHLLSIRVLMGIIVEVVHGRHLVSSFCILVMNYQSPLGSTTSDAVQGVNMVLLVMLAG